MQSLISVFACVGGCGHWGRGGTSVSTPKSHLLFPNDASCVRVRSQGGYGPILWIHVYSGFVRLFLFRSILLK